uniref:Uncharacterized protein n=1 Tax=Rhizophora mucronata TaxID=61149 RepID=A0A2P2JSI5_RHIMU
MHQLILKISNMIVYLKRQSNTSKRLKLYKVVTLIQTHQSNLQLIPNQQEEPQNQTAIKVEPRHRT